MRGFFWTSISVSLQNHLSVSSSPDSCAQRWRTNRRCTVEANRSRTLLSLLLSSPVQLCCRGSLKTDYVLISGRNHEGSWIFRPQLVHVWVGWLWHCTTVNIKCLITPVLLRTPPTPSPSAKMNISLLFIGRDGECCSLMGSSQRGCSPGETHPESIQEVLS